MKRVTKIIILFVFMFIIFNIYNYYDVMAKINSPHELAEESINKVLGEYSENDFIKRGDAIVIIMKTIGLSDDRASQYFDIDFYEPFADDVFSWNPGYSIFRLIKDSYIYFGYSAGIVKGYERKIYPDNYATISDVLCFMARCISTDSNDNVYDIVKQNSIYSHVCKSDMNSYITVKDFKLLLTDFIYTKGELYYSGKYYLDTSPESDKGKNLTYFERYINEHTYENQNTESVRCKCSNTGLELYSLRDYVTDRGYNVDWIGNGDIMIHNDDNEIILSLDEYPDQYKMCIDKAIYVKHLTYEGNKLIISDSFSYLGEYDIIDDTIYLYPHSLDRLSSYL